MNHDQVWLSTNIHSYGAAIYDGMQAREYSEIFPVTNGSNRALFSVMFAAMLTDAVQDCDAGFPNRYRFDCKLFKCDVVTSFFQNAVLPLKTMADAQSKRREN